MEAKEMPYRSVAALSDHDAAYLAGLVDGEGTITLSRRHAQDRRQLIVSISSTEGQLLDWVLAAVGAGKITRKRTTADNHAPGLTYSVSNRQALALLVQIAPYLRSYKRARADLVLEYYVALTPRNGKYTPSLDEARSRFEQQLLALQPKERKFETRVYDSRPRDSRYSS